MLYSQLISQSMDTRVRLLLQRPGLSPSPQIMRVATPRNPLDPYDHLVQRPPFPGITQTSHKSYPKCIVKDVFYITVFL